jgi:hypothetical protein
MADHLKRIAGSFWFKATLSLVLLTLLLRRTDLSQLAGVVARANPGWVLAAYLAYMGSQFMSLVRWRMLARPLGFDEPFGRYFNYYCTGMYMNLFAPSTVAGDIGRALLLAGGQKRKTLAFTTVLADRGLGFIALTWVGAFGILTQPWYPVPAPLYYGAWVVPPATLAGWVWGPLLAARFLSPTNKWRVLIERDLAPYWNDRRLLMRTTVLAMAYHVIQISTQFVLAWALALPVPVSFFFVFVPVVNILGMIPISFSGIGVREGGYALALVRIGVDHEFAVALGLLSSAVVLATGVSAALVFVFNRTPVVVPAAE